MKQHFAAIERYRERFDNEDAAAPLPESWVGNAEECLMYLLNYMDGGGDCEQVLRSRIAIIAGRLGLDSSRICGKGRA